MSERNDVFHPSLSIRRAEQCWRWKCVLACSLEKQDVFKEDGSIDRTKEKELTEKLAKDEELKKKLLKAIDECDVSAKADKCETAYEFVKCKKSKVRQIRKRL
ncbi:uncharacterized protein [Halyomorpha halys]|uniref:uncharacterized protein n=1 Tax=Halyomorpha halys TaxID=286706 RepID=UPI0034D1EFED